MSQNAMYELLDTSEHESLIKDLSVRRATEIFVSHEPEDTLHIADNWFKTHPEYRHVLATTAVDSEYRNNQKMVLRLAYVLSLSYWLYEQHLRNNIDLNRPISEYMP